MLEATILSEVAASVLDRHAMRRLTRAKVGMMLDVVEARVLGQDGNAGVVQLPARRFPQIVLTGDTVRNWTMRLGEISAKLTPLADQELRADLAELEDAFLAVVTFNERTLSAHGVQLPYVKSEPK